MKKKIAHNREIGASGINPANKNVKNPLSLRCDSSKPEEESEDGRFRKFSSGDDGRICDESVDTDLPFFIEERQHTKRSGCRESEGQDRNIDSDASNARSQRQQGQGKHRRPGNSKENGIREVNRTINGDKFKESWYEAATRLYIVDDGLPGRLDGITVSKWRKESLMAAGNAIVPQVAFEIFKAIEQTIKCQ